MEQNNLNIDLILDKEIKDCLTKNTQWSGSSEEMWQKIVSELKPRVPWWKQAKTWLAPVAAAIIILAFLFNNSATDQPEYTLIPEETPQSLMMTRTMLAEWQLATVSITPPEIVYSGTKINLGIELLPLAEGITISAKPPIIRLLNNGGEYSVISESQIQLWTNQALVPNQALVTQVTLTVPTNPGEYLIEIEIEAIKNDDIVYIHQQELIKVN